MILPLALGGVLLAGLSLAGLILHEPAPGRLGSFFALWGAPLALALVILPLLLFGVRRRRITRRYGPWYWDYTPSEILHTIRWRIRRWRHWH